VCNLVENLLFSTLILGSVFNDYVVFYRDRVKHVTDFTPRARSSLLSTIVLFRSMIKAWKPV